MDVPIKDLLATIGELTVEVRLLHAELARVTAERDEAQAQALVNGKVPEQDDGMRVG